MFGRLYRIIPARLRAKTIRALARAVVGVLLDLVAVVGFVPLLAMIANPQQITENQYLHAIYQWSGVQHPLVFVLLSAVVLFVVLVLKNAVVLRIALLQKKFTSALFEELSVAAFKDTYRRGLLYIRTHNSNKLVNEIAHSTLVFATMAVNGALVILSEGVLLAVICLLVLLYNPVLFVALLLVFVPFALLYTKVLRKKMQQMGKQENDLRITQYRTINESLRGYTDVKLTGSFDRVIAQYKGLLTQMAKPRNSAEIFREIPARLIELVVLLGIIVLIGVSMLWKGDGAENQLVMTMGVFVVVAYKVMPAINRIMSSWNTLNKCDFALEFCQGISLQKESPAESAPEPFQSLVLDGVTFAFPQCEPLFTDFSLRIDRGERVLISGASGCGKSTLLHLLMGFYQPQKGTVCINDEPISEKWHATVGYVSQEIFIMDDTLTANITMQQSLDTERFEQVWKWAGLDSLGVRPDERLREWGSRLSGGQRQRIAIARALYRRAELLILDEATAALDQVAESQIMECVDNLPSEVAVVCVAHKPVNRSWRVVRL